MFYIYSSINSCMEKRIQDFRRIVVEAESKREKISLENLPCTKTDLTPAMSEDTLNYHFDGLAKRYVERYNNNEGDDDFNFAGAFLHNIFFSQLQKFSSSNKPSGKSLEFINKHFDNFETLKNSIEKTAMGIQGSGWVYLSSSGKIKTIVNHQVKNDIVLLIDWWEHAWALDYQSKKEKYLKNIWRIINWKVISDRLNLQK